MLIIWKFPKSIAGRVFENPGLKAHARNALKMQYDDKNHTF